MITEFYEAFADYKAKCDRAISDGSLRQFLSSFSIDNEMGNYIDALLYHSEGGKRIRAFLVYLGYSLFSGKFEEHDILLPSLSFELFQTGILAHDDIIDNSDFRRFKPSMHKYLGEGHDGVSKSICVGDFGIIAATQIITTANVCESAKIKAIAHQNNVFASTIAGELKDIEFSYANSVSESEILNMYRLKTAQYTVSGPLVLGAILAGADDEYIKLLSQFGDAVGICFQIRDDILGMFGEQEKLGKSSLSDMREGKKTVLISHFNGVSSAEEKETFFGMYGNSESDANELLNIRKTLTGKGSLDYANSLCTDYTETATKVIPHLTSDTKGRILLEGFLEYMTSRTY